MSRYCPSSNCAVFRETKRPAAFPDAAIHCSHCGSELIDETGDFVAEDPDARESRFRAMYNGGRMFFLISIAVVLAAVILGRVMDFAFGLSSGTAAAFVIFVGIFAAFAYALIYLWRRRRLKKPTGTYENWGESGMD